MSGIVILVGAGPGDPELITVRGARALGRAEVVVFDRLVSPRLLELAPPRAERVYVGKEPGRAAVAQQEIEALLVSRAREGRTVIRLKGGDPFVFGRGGEEVLACARAGVRVEVVPGVSAAIAAPAAAGIPVTHRGLARSFAVATGSSAHGEGVDLRALATAADTLVVLMAAGKLAETCRGLIEAGRSADEPAAIVQWATTGDQREVIGCLGELPALASAASVGPPATLVVGPVVELARARDAEAPPRDHHRRAPADPPGRVPRRSTASGRRAESNGTFVRWRGPSPCRTLDPMARPIVNVTRIRARVGEETSPIEVLLLGPDPSSPSDGYTARLTIDPTLPPLDLPLEQLLRALVPAIREPGAEPPAPGSSQPPAERAG